MRKKKNRLLAALLSFSLCPLPSAVLAEQAETDQLPEELRYEIYPVPHSIEYASNPEEFTVSAEVNVVADSQIDQYTKDYLEEILAENGLTATESEKVVAGKTNILLGVDNSDEFVDEWFDAALEVSDDLFEKNDAYALDVDAEGNTQIIGILGKDTDAAFYGLSSLEMMFSSFEGNKLVEAYIEDYSDMELRGFIEGFYGGFSYEGRETQIRFLRKVKGNMYVFASKTDPYHGGSQWENVYPQEELGQIAHLVDVAKANKVRYAWSFHAGKSGFLNGVSTDPQSSTYSEYQRRLTALEAKFEQLYEIGVRDFHILNDDYNSGTYSDIVNFLNDMNEWIKAKGDCGPLVFCPINYNITWGNTAAEMAAYKDSLDKDILLYWTGEKVNCPVTQSDVDWIYSRTGNEIVNWLNYPCSEHDKAGIYLGSINNYFSTADGLQHSKGLMSNPVNYPEANKVAYFQLMSWLWNNENYSEYADELWQNSFKYIEPEIADSYATVARHVSNCPDSGRYAGVGFPESEALKANLEAAQEKLLAGTAGKDDPDVKAVYDEMENVITAVADMKENASTELKVDLMPWLDSLESVATAIVNEIDCLESLNDGDLASAWAYFSKGAAALDGWDATPTPQYADKKAKAGSKRLQPFAQRIESHLSNLMMPALDPSYDKVTPTGISSFNTNTNIDKMLDGDETTFASWNEVQTEGDYYGVDLGRVADVHDITIIQGETDTHHDRFHESTLEYSVDGTNWTPIEENINKSNIVYTGLSIQARYVRLRVTGFTEPSNPSKTDFWTRVREFVVNKPAEQRTDLYTNLADDEVGTVVTDLGETTERLEHLGSITLKPDQYIGLQLPAPAFAASVTGESLPEGVVAEYSLDGSTWSSGAIDGRATILFARLRNTGQSAAALTASSALAITKTTGASATATSDLPLKEGSWANLIDGNRDTYAWTSVNQAAGQVINIDLGRELPFNALSIYMAENRPRLYHGTVSVSADQALWTPVLTIDASNDDTTIDGTTRYKRVTGDSSMIRYIKLEVTDSAKEETTEHSAFLKLHEIMLNDSPLPVDIPSLFTGTDENMDGAADQNLSTAFAAQNEAGRLEYVVTRNAEQKNVRIVQDADAISGAKVSVQMAGQTGWTELGVLDQAVKDLPVSVDGSVSRVRIDWDANCQKPKIYEIILTSSQKDAEDVDVASVAALNAVTGETGSTIAALNLPSSVLVTMDNGSTRRLGVTWNTDGLDLSVAGTYRLEGTLTLPAGVTNTNSVKATMSVILTEPVETVENLALSEGKTVTSSGAEVEGSWTADLAFDGVHDTDESRWSSPLLKNGTAADQTQTPQWLQIDLGKTCEIQSVHTYYFKKVYATDYDISVSTDGSQWTVVKEGAGLAASSDTMNPEETIVFATPVIGRYVKFDYKAINHFAAGNALSVRDIEIMGKESAAAASYTAPAVSVKEWNRNEKASPALIQMAYDYAKTLQMNDFSNSTMDESAWTLKVNVGEALALVPTTQKAVDTYASQLNALVLDLRFAPSSQKLEDLAE